ncbi:MAG TPA: LUD domain-containing protein [Candidatus Saccharimonadales bacterium]|nr:LUD domain-containing protein [Candidatus Saccharimonadales bacterium]
MGDVPCALDNRASASQNAAVESMSELIDTFEANALEAAAEVRRIPVAREAIHQEIEETTNGALSIVLGAGEFLPEGLMESLRDIQGVLESPTDEQLSNAGVGICAAFAGVASAGSVCIAMGPPLVTMASLLMPLHIVLLSAKRIVARPRDLFDPACLDGEGLRRNLVFITGPSATADMGPLVRGVHGPHRLRILLLE